MRAGVALIALLLAILGGAYYFGQVKPLTGYLHQGLDLKGGTYLVLGASTTRRRAPLPPLSR